MKRTDAIVGLSSLQNAGVDNEDSEEGGEEGGEITCQLREGIQSQ
jgi:hypothetical protein